MNRDEIIRMAREAGIRLIGDGFGKPDRTDVWATQDEFERFTALVAAAEREACANLVVQCSWNVKGGDNALTVDACARAIRARGQAS